MIYENIKKICGEQNISVSELEKKAGLSNGAVGKWNKPDSNPGIKNVESVAKVLNVDIRQLISK